jgi:cobalt/nickel transport system permease protein
MTGSQSHKHYPSDKDNVSRSIDVRSKIIASVIVVIGCSFIVTINQLLWFLILLLFYFILLQPRKTLFKYTLAALPIILSLTLISFFSFSSSPILYQNLFYSTIHNNVTFALFTGLRGVILILFILVIINSEESFFEIIYGLDDLKMPRLLTNLTFLTYRFFFLMQEEFSRILEARSNRFYGQKIYLNLTSLKLTGNIIGSVLARSFKRAEYISATLSARGFTGKMSHPEQPWTPMGFFFIFITVFYVLTFMIIGENLSIFLLSEL